MLDYHIVEDIKRKINSVTLTGCEKIKCGDVMYFPLLLRRSLNFSISECFYFFFQILKSLIFSNYTINIIGKPDSLFFISEYTCRKDLLLNFQKAISCIENRIECFCGIKRKYIGLKYFYLLKYIFLWEKCLKIEIHDWRLRLFIIKSLFRYFINYNYISNQLAKNNLSINKLITLCDVHATDSFFVQMLNSNGIITVTLQHGTYSSFGYDIQSFIGSFSRFCFYIGQFTLDEAKRCMDTSNKIIKLVGPMTYIDYSLSSKPEKLNYKKIGLIIDGEMVRKDNIAMLKFFNGFCKRRGIKLLAKLHPTNNIEKYREYLSEDVYEKVYSKEINAIEFINKVDIVIVSLSTVFLESLLAWKPTLIYYHKDQAFDYYKNISNKVKFETEEQLESLLNEVKRPDYIRKLEEIRNYMSVCGNIKENYKKAFNEIGIY